MVVTGKSAMAVDAATTRSSRAGGAGRASQCDRIKIVPVDSVSRWLERDRLGSRIQVIR
jgi:hypothetical protein